MGTRVCSEFGTLAPTVFSKLTGSVNLNQTQPLSAHLRRVQSPTGGTRSVCERLHQLANIRNDVWKRLLCVCQLFL